jgi:uncharacterized protein (TIGR02266 family)
MSNAIKREGGRVTCSDQRQGTRAQLARVSARYAVGTEEVVDGEVLNVSMGGMFLRATRPLPPGTRIDLELRIVGEQGPLRGTGEVMWSRETATQDGAPSGMGLRFVGLDPKACDVISRLVVVREQTIYGLGPEDETSPTSTRAPEPSLPLDLVRRKEAPREDAVSNEAGEPTSLRAIVIDAKRAGESTARSVDAHRSRRDLAPRPRAGLAAAPVVGVAALLFLAIAPAGDSPAPSFGAPTADDLRLINSFLPVAPRETTYAPRLPAVPAEVAPVKAEPSAPPAPPPSATALVATASTPPAAAAVSASAPKHASAHARAKSRAASTGN